MGKRGQVTIFAIIGIVIVILVILFLFIRTKVYIGPATQQDLEGELIPIQEHIEECLIEMGEPRLRQIGLQGGYIQTPENTFRLYNGERVSYLCYNIEDRPYCRQRVLRVADMEEQLAEILKEELTRGCINVQGFRKIGTNLEQGELDLDVDIGDDVVTFNVDMQIVITRGDSRAELNEFSSTVEVPLGRLFDAGREALNSEAVSGVFDSTLYSLAKTQLTNKMYVIQKLQPYPDKIYIMKIKDAPSEDDPYIFQFFIEGEPR